MLRIDLFTAMYDLGAVGRTFGKSERWAGRGLTVDRLSVDRLSDDRLSEDRLSDDNLSDDR